MSKICHVGIIGGGVSGVVTALQLANYGIENILFEQGASLVNGPPFCHLHAGGNLYPEISDEQCKLLMRQSIEMARLFTQSIDQRPTFISIPKSEKFEVAKIENRLNMLVEHYKQLIDEDPANAILGAPEDYYKILSYYSLANNPQNNFTFRKVLFYEGTAEAKVHELIEGAMQNGQSFCDVDSEEIKISLQKCNEIKTILDRLTSRHILTVSDASNFARLGGMIRLYTEANKTRIRINLGAVKKEELVCSSKLLRLADIVESQPH